MKKRKFGVSPALLLSLYGDRFTPGEVLNTLPLIRHMGFDCFQSEIVFDTMLPLWEKEAAAVAAAAREQEIEMSQLVAHFMMDAFCDQHALFSEKGLAEMEQVLKIADTMEFHGPITVPIGPFAGLDDLQSEGRTLCRRRLSEKMLALAQLARPLGNPVAIEVQPGALISGAKEISDFLKGTSLGYNYDTGHAWASGAKDTVQFPLLFGRRLLGTHLCDNDAVHNLSLCPGEGTIDWRSTIQNLMNSGYQGSLDLEIFTEPSRVQEKYTAGKRYLEHLLED